LIDFLFKNFNKKVILLVDEYDAPLNSCLGKPHYSSVLDVINEVYRGIKDNKQIEKTVMTGILGLAKGDIFSGFNHLTVYGVLNNKYAQYFGFTEKEINNLMRLYLNGNDTDKLNQIKKIKEWYNGYTIGKYTIYNPWSIMHCLNKFSENNNINNNKLECHWLNSGNPAFLGSIFIECSKLINADFVKLMDEGVIELYLDKYILNLDNKDEPRIFWYLCLHCGYLTKEEFDSNLYRVPNIEVMTFFYDNLLTSWVKNNCGGLNLNKFGTGLLNTLDDYKALQTFIEENLLTKLDTTKKTESDFHVLIGGAAILSVLSVMENPNSAPLYRIYSERYVKKKRGRIDNLFLPTNDESKNVIIHEYKVVDSAEDMKDALLEGLWQIYTKQYLQEPLNLIGYYSHCENIKTRSVVFYKYNEKWNMIIKEFIHSIQNAKEINKLFGELFKSLLNESKDKSEARKKMLEANKCDNLIKLLSRHISKNNNSSEIIIYDGNQFKNLKRLGINDLFEIENDDSLEALNNEISNITSKGDQFNSTKVDYINNLKSKFSLCEYHAFNIANKLESEFKIKFKSVMINLGGKRKNVNNANNHGPRPRPAN
jgi:hypothetical protein